MKKILFILLVLPLLVKAQTGIIITVAGNGSGGNGGDSGLAKNASLANPLGISFDKKGNLYIVTTPYFPKVRKVDTAGIITTFAGNGISGFSGDSGLATSAQLNYPIGIAVDAKNNVYISEGSNHRIRKVDTSGIITTFAGNGTGGYGGDSGLATSAKIFAPWGINFDRKGNLFIADHANNRVRKIDTFGIITTVAGNGIGGFSGDSGLAVNAKLWQPSSVVIDSIGNLYIGDWFNNRIRKVDTFGIITTIVGDHGQAGFNGDNISAISASIGNPYAVVLDDSNNLFIADYGNERIRKVNAITGIISTIAGTGVGGYNGDSILADTAEIYLPEALAFDKCWNLYISVVANGRVRKVDLRSCIPDTGVSTSIVVPNSTINIHPNPVSDVMHINNIATSTQYTISNLLGVIVLQGFVSKGSNSIDMGSLAPGMYVLCLSSREQRVIRKIVKE